MVLARRLTTSLELGDGAKFLDLIRLRKGSALIAHQKDGGVAFLNVVPQAFEKGGRSDPETLLCSWVDLLLVEDGRRLHAKRAQLARNCGDEYAVISFSRHAYRAIVLPTERVSAV